MAHSLEARSPLLDTKLIERLAAVRARDKIGFRHPKPLLRQAFRSLVPASVWRRPKHGFGVPIDHWFDGMLGERYADEVLGPDGRLTTLLDKKVLSGMYEAHRTGRERHGAQMWTLLTVEAWLRDSSAPQPLAEPAAVPLSGVET